MKVIPVGVAGDLLDVLAGVAGEDGVERVAELQHLLGVDIDVRGLTLEPAQRLVDHHPRMGRQ